MVSVDDGLTRFSPRAFRVIPAMFEISAVLVTPACDRARCVKREIHKIDVSRPRVGAISCPHHPCHGRGGHDRKSVQCPHAKTRKGRYPCLRWSVTQGLLQSLGPVPCSARAGGGTNPPEGRQRRSPSRRLPDAARTGTRHPQGRSSAEEGKALAGVRPGGRLGVKPDGNQSPLATAYQPQRISCAEAIRRHRRPEKGSRRSVSIAPPEVGRGTDCPGRRCAVAGQGPASVG